MKKYPSVISIKFEESKKHYIYVYFLLLVFNHYIKFQKTVKRILIKSKINIFITKFSLYDISVFEKHGKIDYK